VISAITLSLFLFSVIGFYSTESLSAAGFCIVWRLAVLPVSDFAAAMCQGKCKRELGRA